jgi:SNF2 family DNA or RNA helicase
LVKPEDTEESKQEQIQVEEPASKQTYFLIVEENLERVAYKKERVARDESLARGLPGAVRSELKRHQKAGLDWLQRGWIAGVPGMLLADDMGLGKSLQALSFIAWLQGFRERVDASAAKPGPIIIVAPTGLLANWQEEAEKHLHAPGLGNVCAAYGRHLAALKHGKERDIHRGEPMLDTGEIQRAEWVLTTYETLRDYHHSFAAIHFSAAVFDEMQKVKNPTSQLARAAKALNADFILGLTGTPIENRLEDLWAIMDIVYPGFLGHDLKSFSETFLASDNDSLRRLRAILMDPSEETPEILLRRMKHDHLDGLPKKIIHPHREVMPKPQADAYGEIVQSARSGRRGAMLETLHRLRGVSLHPVDPQQGQSFDPDEYCGMSARLTTAFKVLEAIHRKGEKALIFVESLDMQDLLAVLIKKRFGLKHRPLQINGAIAGESRQKAVRVFQDPANRGFDVMILSPKAGGVGLTLTAANHVIHLSRWWNPAVEDQCTDRVYRIGQDRVVNVYYPLAVHPSTELADFSFDLKLNELLDRKRALSRDMLMPPVMPMADEGELYAATIQSVGAAAAASVDEASIDEIDRMEPSQFENWALRRVTARGYRPNRTPISGDAGADGLLVHAVTKERVLLQCKHRQPGASCDDEPIDDLLRARSAYGDVDRLVALTNAHHYTAAAAQRAAQHGITLIARSQISMWPHGCF